MLVAARRAAQRRQPQPAQHLAVARLGAGRDLDLLLAVERRDGHRAAEHRGGRGHLDDADEVGALAAKALVVGDVDLDVEVAGARPGLAGVARRR